LSNDDFYDSEDHVDAGGWTGGEFVLGAQGDVRGLNRREILARAAEKRIEKDKELERGNGEGRESGSGAM